jgi:hypothetical protein
VSSGIGAALFLVELWFVESTAKGSQSMNWYAPNPPFAAGMPPIADPRVLVRAQSGVAALVTRTNAAIDKLGG